MLTITNVKPSYKMLASLNQSAETTLLADCQDKEANLFKLHQRSNSDLSPLTEGTHSSPTT